MQSVVWFDGLGSAVVGGVVAALVAVFVTRAQLNHDRKSRLEEACDNAASAVLFTLADLRSMQRDRFSNTELERIRVLYQRLQKELVAVERAADHGDKSFRGWLQEFRAGLQLEMVHGRHRTGTNAAMLDWVVTMTEQVVPRLEDRTAAIEVLERPAFSRE